MVLWLKSDEWVYLLISYPRLPLGQLFQIWLMDSAGLWNRPSYEASDNLLVYKNFFISYMLSDQVWWHNMKWFLSYCKNYICKFMQANSWHKLFKFHLSFRVSIVWKEGKKIKKLEYFKNKKSFLDEIKNIFHSF